MSRKARAPEHHRIGPDHPLWPASLQALSDPPRELRVCGALPPLVGAVAVVGTRYADDAALELAESISAELAAAGRTVISGGALGIDAAAHRGALAVGGPTLAVLANGFEPPFPRQHAGLFAEITAAGALVSEREDGTPPERWTFLARNRLIAAMAESVVVVQAPARSGALSTAAVAAKLEKTVFSVPYAPWVARGEGCLALLRRGARICTSARDVLSVPAQRPRPDSEPGRTHGKNLSHVDDLDEDERAVWSVLRVRPKHPDNLCAALDLPIVRVQRALLQLLLRGLATECGSGRYARAPKPEQR